MADGGFLSSKTKKEEQNAKDTYLFRNSAAFYSSGALRAAV